MKTQKNIRISMISAAILAAVARAHAQSFSMNGGCCGLEGSSDGTAITYDFGGTLAQPFGTLAVGTPFTGSFSYAIAQPNLNTGIFPAYRGDYVYQTLSLTIGGSTVTDNGTGVINHHDHGTYDFGNPSGPLTYPTDLFHIYTFGVSGSFGGLTLAPGAGIQLVLQDTTGTAWSSTALPGAGLTMANLTPGGATFIQLQSTPTGFPEDSVIARGPLDVCVVPEPGEYAAVAGLALVGFGVWRRTRK